MSEDCAFKKTGKTIIKQMVSKLSKEFALKTEPERRSAYADMLLSPVMHTDCPNARENGNSCYVYVCATPDRKTLYFVRRKKGHEGVFIDTGNDPFPK